MFCYSLAISLFILYAVMYAGRLNMSYIQQLHKYLYFVIPAQKLHHHEPSMFINIEH